MMVDGRKHRKDYSEQPPSPDTQPEALTGSVVQIVVDSEIIGSPILLPPVVVRSMVLPEDHYATIGGKMARADIDPIFFGTPLPDFRTVDSEGRFRDDVVGIRFYSLIPEFEPHYLLDKDFLAYFRTHEHESVLVRVWVLGSAENSGERDSLNDSNYVFMGDGTLQVYIPGVGFSRSWNPDVSFMHELNAVEKILLSKFPDEAAVRKHIESWGGRA